MIPFFALLSPDHELPSIWLPTNTIKPISIPKVRSTHRDIYLLPTNNWRQRQTNINNIDNPPTNNWRQRQTNTNNIDNPPTNNWRQRQTNTNNIDNPPTNN
jgi:hypothetical protein